MLHTIKAGPLKIGLPFSLQASGALAVIALGFGIRLTLIALGWPHTNFDEGTLGEMAMNIAFRGDHPAFFYGQDYMGSLQAYIGAFFFHLLGVSFFSLRLGTVLLDTLFLASMYVLVRLLYGPGMALISTLLLALASVMVYYREIQAIGGYPETLLFGALLFALASWLALTARTSRQARVTRRNQVARLLAFTAWGITAGLGLWSDLLVLPYLIFSGVLLLLTCWRDLRSLAPLCLLLGALIGAMPLILYNFQPGQHASSLDILLALFHGGAGAPHFTLQRLLPRSIPSTILVGIPTMTSYPAVCGVSSTLYMGGKGSAAQVCAIEQGVWTFFWIAMWLCALFLAIKGIVDARGSGRRIGRIGNGARETNMSGDIVEHETDLASERWRAFVRNCARLALLLAFAMTVSLYVISPVSVLQPLLNSRYLLCLQIGIPALIYPLWRWASLKANSRWVSTFKTLCGRVALIVLALLFVMATARTFADIPGTLTYNAQQENLVQRLEQVGAFHIYSDFQSCDRIEFQSYERIRCSDLKANLQPVGDRYKPDGVIVRADPLSSYVFPIGSPQISAVAQKFKKSGQAYHEYMFDGYIVIKPV